MPIADIDQCYAMFDRAKEGRFAYPAINVTNLETLGAALEAWGLGRLTLDAEDGESPGDEAVREFLRGGLEGFKVEAAVLDRDRSAKSKFSLLAADDLAASLSAHVGAEPP